MTETPKTLDALEAQIKHLISCYNGEVSDDSDDRVVATQMFFARSPELADGKTQLSTKFVVPDDFKTDPVDGEHGGCCGDDSPTVLYSLSYTQRCCKRGKKGLWDGQTFIACWNSSSCNNYGGTNFCN